MDRRRAFAEGTRHRRHPSAFALIERNIACTAIFEPKHVAFGDSERPARVSKRHDSRRAERISFVAGRPLGASSLVGSHPASPDERPTSP